MIQLIRGFRDILPEEVEVWQNIERTAVTLFENFGFKEIRLPVLEKAELFSRSIGQDTDIVEKEMYTFPDSKGNPVTMRPEATASVVRAYIQHKLYAKDPVHKLYTIGPMFRRERPQKGRYRQFYQINAEVFGVDSPLIDAQLIMILMTLFSRLNVTDVKPHINSLGCEACRPRFKEALSELLYSSADSLCSNCVKRSRTNPLRVLDCKVPACRKAMLDAPSILDFLCTECKQHFDTVKDSLESLNVEYEIDKFLVRGLDYYTRTTFEIQTGSLGAQNAVAGGGRYDSLVKTLGGPEKSATGFAIGFDRLVELVTLNNSRVQSKPEIFIAAIGDKSKSTAFHWANALAIDGIKVEIDLGDRSLKSQMKRANRLEAKHVLIVGEKELEDGDIIMRNMTTKEQILIPVNGIVEIIKAKLRC